jgi:hypothetical protein
VVTSKPRPTSPPKRYDTLIPPGLLELPLGDVAYVLHLGFNGIGFPDRRRDERLDDATPLERPIGRTADVGDTFVVAMRVASERILGDAMTVGGR